MVTDTEKTSQRPNYNVDLINGEAENGSQVIK